MATGNENYKVIPAAQWPQLGEAPDQSEGLRRVFDFFRRFLIVLDWRDREVSKAINEIGNPVWTAVSAFTNSWVNFGTPYGDAAYCKNALGFVHLRGVIKSGALNAGAFVLPVGFRPSARVSLMGVSLSGATFVITKNDITTDGVVIVGDGPTGGNNALMLDGLAFYAGS